LRGISAAQLSYHCVLVAFCECMFSPFASPRGHWSLYVTLHDLSFWFIILGRFRFLYIDKSCTGFSSTLTAQYPPLLTCSFLQSSRTLQGRTGYGLFFPIIVIIITNVILCLFIAPLLYLSLDGVIPEAFIYLCIRNIMVAARIDALDDLIALASEAALGPRERYWSIPEFAGKSNKAK